MKILGKLDILVVRTEGFSCQEIEFVESLYKEQGKEKMYEYYTKRKMLPYAAKTFSTLNLDKEYWTSIFEGYRERNKKVIAFLDAAYTSMRNHGVTKVFLSENFGALLAADGDLGMFGSFDTDNCYSAEEKDKIYAALTEMGCRCEEVYSINRLNGSCWYPPKEFDLPEDFCLGLKPTPLSRLYQPSFVGLDDFEVWEDMRTYKNTNIQIPNPTALMYICMLHISLHSFSRSPDIRLYADVKNMTKTNVDYERIVKWAKRNHTRTRIAVVSTLANNLVKTNVPESLVNLSKRKAAVLSVVYDSQKNDLKYEPHGIDLLKIEARCNDKSSILGLMDIAFPNKAWMQETYGGSGITSYVKHIKRIL